MEEATRRQRFAAGTRDRTNLAVMRAADGHDVLLIDADDQETASDFTILRNERIPAGAGYTSLEIKVNFVRPLTAETGRVRCEAKLIHLGGRTATAEGRVVDEAGKLYAHGTTTCLIFRS